MATQKGYVQNFDNTKGMDLWTSDLVDDEVARAARFENVTAVNGQSIRKRDGYVFDGPPACPLGIHAHTYFDPDTGATRQELIGLGYTVCRLKETSLTITSHISGGALYFQPVLVDGSVVYRFSLWIAAENKLWEKDFYPNPNAWGNTIKDLIAAINTEATDYITATIPAYCATFVSIAADYTLTLAEAHDFAVRDFVSLLGLGDDGGMFGAWVTAVPAVNKITVAVGSMEATSVPFADLIAGQPIGDWSGMLSSVPFGAYAVPGDGQTFSLPFEVWEAVPGFGVDITNGYACNPNASQFEAYCSKRKGEAVYADRPLPSFVDMNSCCFIGFGDGYGVTIAPTPLPFLKYDGKRVYRAGLQNPTGFSAAVTVAGSNTWRYIMRFRYVDNRGNVITSNVSDEVVVSSAGTVTLTLPYLGNATSWTNVASGDFEGDQNNTRNLNLGYHHRFFPGDIATFLDSSGDLVRSEIRSITATTIKISDTVSVLDEARISCNLTIEIFRTVNNGNGSAYYKLKEVPNGVMSFVDNIADSVIVTKERYSAPDYGQEHDPPPAARFLVAHAGGLVAAGVTDNPNQVCPSVPGEPEYWPLANRFDVASGTPGAVTAIASDTADRLAVFKERAYYDIVGDIANGVYSIITVSEGDWGVSSHASLKRVGNFLIGVGPLGPVFIRGGTMDTAFGLRVAPAFRKVGASGVSPYDFSRAIGFNDYLTRSYVVVVPPSQEATAMDGGMDKYLALEYDYELMNGWRFLSFSRQGGDWSGGMAICNGKFYAQARSSGYLPEGVEHSSGGLLIRRIHSYVEYKDKFHDEGAAINFNWRTQFNPLKTPSVDKEFMRVMLYALSTEYDERIPFSVAVRVFKNFDTSVSSTFHDALAFALSDMMLDVRFVPDKAKAMSLDITNGTLMESPFLSALEFLVNPQYLPEDMKR